jgi:nucleoside phosphorylase/glycosyltransferase involved in cell wall biosynthesis
LMNRWSSAAGGIQTVNRELACAMKLQDPSLNCIAVVTVATEQDSNDAKLRGINLIAGNTADEWSDVVLSEELKSIRPAEVIAVIGHSHFSGHQALALRKRFFDRAMSIHFVHMSPMDTESLKEYRKTGYVQEREERQKRELEIASKADVVACVGPRLWRYFRDQLITALQLKIDVIEIDCGISRVDQERIPPLNPTVLCLGRTDSINVKGLDLFARAAGYVTRWWPERAAGRVDFKPRFVVRGVDAKGTEAEDLEAHLARLAREAGDAANINVRPYTTSVEELRAEYRAASAFVMPSREEGFGLVACEALSLGVPIVISGNSGLADGIKMVAREANMTTTQCIVSHDGVTDDFRLAERYADTILYVLCNEKSAVDYARLLRERMLQSYSWEAAARQLLQRIGAHAPMSADPGATSRRTAATQAAADVLRRNADLMKVPEIVTVGVAQAIVVSVRKGTSPEIPKQLEGVDVIVREVEDLQPTGAPIVRSGDRVLVNGMAVSRVGALVVDDVGTLYATTSTHALPLKQGDAVAIATSGGILDCRLARSDRSADLSLLALSASATGAPVTTLADPRASSGTVTIPLQDHSVYGVITAHDMQVRIGSLMMGNMFEVRVTDGKLLPGDSGALVVDAQGRPTGAVVATTFFGGATHAYATSFMNVLDALRLQLLASGSLNVQPPLATSVTLPRIVLFADAFTSTSMLSVLRNVSRIQHGPTVYYEGDFGVTDVRVLFHSLPQSGNLTAAVAAANMLQQFRPDFVALIGIAGGLRDVAVGDVVISSEIVYYEPAKISTAGIDPRYRIVGLTPPWVASLLRNFSGDVALPRVHVGPVASGEKIITSPESVRDLIGIWGRPLAIEMEAAGVAEAVGASGRNIPLVVIRGIADVLDGSKHRHGAADLAAKAALDVAAELVPLLLQHAEGSV